VKVLYRQTASDDIVRQFRYYLLTAEAPEIALRFREAVRRTIQSLGQNPHVGPRYSSSNPRVQNLRSWPVAGFEAIRIYDGPNAALPHLRPLMQCRGQGGIRTRHPFRA
jgi:plasmid stabilization system protein ParE